MRATWLTGLMALSCAVTPGKSIVCYVCLPELTGGAASINAAVQWRAKVARLWPGLEEGSFGECKDLSNEDRFQRSCPTTDEDQAACIKAYNGFWTARSCGELPTDKNFGCYEQNGVTTCYYQKDFGNNLAASPLVAPLLVLVCLILIWP